MKLKASSLILLTFAVALAACAALVARSMLAPHAAARTAEAAAAQAPEAPNAPPIFVATAADAIEPGDFLRSDRIHWTEMEAAKAPAAGFAAKAAGDRQLVRELSGATIRRSFKAGDVITQDAVLYPGNPGFIAAVLTPGLRAVSSNSGLVSAGDRVDVILTLKRESAEAMADENDKTAGLTKLAAQTILEDVRVLALNSDAESIAPQPAAKDEGESRRGGKAAPQTRRADYRTITLEVRPEDAEKLVVASQAGVLQVALRGLREGEAPAPAAKSRRSVTHLQDATGILGTQRPAAQTVTTYQGTAAVPLTF